MDLSTTVNFLLGLQTQIKINHWQTKKHARHVAYGEFYDSMDDLIDKFIEVSIGKYGRFKLSDETQEIPLFNIYEINTKHMLRTVNETFMVMKNSLNDSDGDLLNIIDEMVAEVNKLSYLLTQD